MRTSLHGIDPLNKGSRCIDQRGLAPSLCARREGRFRGRTHRKHFCSGGHRAALPTKSMNVIADRQPSVQSSREMELRFAKDVTSQRRDAFLKRNISCAHFQAERQFHFLHSCSLETLTNASGVIFFNPKYATASPSHRFPGNITVQRCTRGGANPRLISRFI